MAKVSVHGETIGTLYYTTKAKRFMSDGTVLKNIGFGWKIGGRAKAGVDIRTLYETMKAKQADTMARRPMLAKYRAALHDLAGMDKRWKLHLAVQMMPEDPDGVWSECCDGYGDNVHADLDELVELCRLYKAATEESADLKQAA